MWDVVSGRVGTYGDDKSADGTWEGLYGLIVEGSIGMAVLKDILVAICGLPLPPIPRTIPMTILSPSRAFKTNVVHDSFIRRLWM
ncbi:hypothetical protein BDQ17DRAFT_1373330 [Cyathus striatus]|nr:hypothetical protein BDQ17DRAFT_1373330 [Cyathus striatus]